MSISGKVFPLLGGHTEGKRGDGKAEKVDVMRNAVKMTDDVER